MVEKFNDMSRGLRDKSAGQAVQVYVELVKKITVARFEETVKHATIARKEQAGTVTRQNENGDTVFTMGLLPKPLERVMEALDVSMRHTCPLTVSSPLAIHRPSIAFLTPHM
jgi:hypothetical protein